MIRCPECGTPMKKERKEISPGIYAKVEICPKCEEEWVDEDSYEQIRSLFKRKVFKVGGSLAVRLPKELADLVGISDGDDLSITARKRRIIIEHR